MNTNNKDLLDKFIVYNCLDCMSVLIKEPKEQWMTFDIDSGNESFGVYGCKKCGSYWCGKGLWEMNHGKRKST